MEERGSELGYAVVELAEKKLVIHDLVVLGYDKAEKPDTDTLFALDLLMRSAASYGEFNHARDIETSFPDFYDFFKLRGFATGEERAFAPMDRIVHYKTADYMKGHTVTEKTQS